MHAQMQPEAPSGTVADAPFDILFHELAALREHVTREGEGYLARFGPEAAHGPAAASARNLAQYIALRQHDLRPLQERLARVGLSSLGRCEGNVLYTIDRVGILLGRVLGRDWPAPGGEPPVPDFGEGRQVVERTANVLFGPPAPDRSVRIMVTLPSEAAGDYARVRALVDAGMTCARINCAHDDAEAWAAMAAHVRRAEAETGRTCRIQMDLAGHKIRTATLTLRGEALRLAATRPEKGADRVPARVVLTGGGAPDAEGYGLPLVVLPPEVIGGLKRKDRLRFADLRGKTRELVVGKAPADGAWWAECPRTAVLGPGLSLAWERPDDEGRYRPVGEARVVETLAPVDEARVREGERFRLGGPPVAEPGSDGPAAAGLTVGCTHPGVVGVLKPDDPVWIDDGRCGAVVEAVDPQGAWLRVVQAGDTGAPVRRDKGLNFPSTALDLPPLTPKDLADLETVCAHADVVGFSFVESGEDVERLGAALAERGRPDMPVVAKIETAAGVRNLPGILLTGMGRRPMGVMIARGDLAVELGNVRMAEIQEEMLWLCEAAHVPLVWATQVLERLAKKGMSSRPELTDAAMGVRAECVMLNKGPYITRAVNTLDRILSRMQDHQRKKTSRLRALNIWRI
jgi:pyruvate kinase